MERVMLYFLLIIIGMVNAKSIDVDLSSELLSSNKWLVTCKWKLPLNQTLLSVTLYNNDAIINYYRPELEQKWHREYPGPKGKAVVDCVTQDPSGEEGSCVLVLQLNQTPTENFTISCEAFGGPPMFLATKKDVFINVINENNLQNIML